MSDRRRNERRALTETELTVLKLLTEGKRKPEIVAALGTTVRSFQKVREGLFAKLGARTDPHAAAIGFRGGLIAVDRRGERGQVMVLAAVSMLAICAMAGFTIDVASWYQAHRKEQSVADAAALAAVKNLPGNQGQASADATSYAVKNSGALTSTTYSTKYMSGDTVTVTASATAPSFFLKVLGVSSAKVSATSTATAENLQKANSPMPFGVINTQPQLAGVGCPCLGVSTTLTLGKTGPGGFGIINIDGSRGGTSPGTLAGWIQNGCSCSQSAPVNLYSDPGAKFNSSQVQSAMNAAIGRDLLFPVYDTTSGNGANLQYHVIGWSGFHLTGWSAQGSSATMTGYFTKVDWAGQGSTSPANYFGATTSVLTG